jgi:cytosine/adenosine deaminase-related metal-dependent hydrolase
MRFPRNVSDLAFTNADVGGTLTTVRVSGSCIAGLGEPPRERDRVVDLRGDRLLAGLINAHDHLQLNSLAPPDLSRRYAHVTEWIRDINMLRGTDREFESRVAIPIEDRLFIGGLKNLFSGVTTVAHHDPLYPPLLTGAFPTRVATGLGWSHSLYIDGEQAVQAAFCATPADRPWIIHAAEGLNEAAAAEFDRLDALGCLAANTLLVHGIALDGSRRTRLIEAGAGLVWCPASNLHLFGSTAAVADLVAADRVALGTDSRLSGSRDLLTELTVAAGLGMQPAALERLVTTVAAELLRLPDRGVLRTGASADLLVVPMGRELTRVPRTDVRLVVIEGIPRYGDADYVDALGLRAEFGELQIDGRHKLLATDLLERLSSCRAREAGIDLGRTWRAA